MTEAGCAFDTILIRGSGSVHPMPDLLMLGSGERARPWFSGQRPPPDQDRVIGQYQRLVSVEARRSRQGNHLLGQLPRQASN